MRWEAWRSPLASPTIRKYRIPENGTRGLMGQKACFSVSMRPWAVTSTCVGVMAT